VIAIAGNYATGSANRATGGNPPSNTEKVEHVR